MSRAGGQGDRRDFFISHAGEDQGWAEWIGRQLIDAGYTVELDVWEWAAGDNFVAAMDLALRRADRVLAVYTDAYFTKPFARAEHQGAFTASATRRPGRVVPVRVEDCEVPELYAGLIRIELAGLDAPAAVRRLLAGVAGPSGPPDGEVAFPGPRTLVPPSAAVRSAARTASGTASTVPPDSVPPENVPSENVPSAGARGSGAGAAGGAEFPRRLPPVWNVPPRNPFFTGREGALADLHCRIQATPTGPAPPVAVVPLQGMGGVGKTQVAIEYAHRHATDYGIVWWINADSPARVASGLTDLAAALGLPAGGSLSATLSRLWATLGERFTWLLIYDDVGDPHALADLRPPDSGQLLVTSRNPAIGRLARTTEIGEFDRAESVGLLRARCPSLSGEQADLIAAAVGDLPLAVEQAGCFLMDTGLETADYLDLLATRPASAGLADPTVDRHPGLTAVLETSLTRLERLSGGPAAVDLLEVMAFLAPAPLPLTPRRNPGPSPRPNLSPDASPNPSPDGPDRPVASPVSRRRIGIGVGDAATTADVVRRITGLALARRVGTALQMHRLVQDLLRSRMSAGQRAQAARAAYRLLAEVEPGDPDDPASWRSYAVLTPHVQALLGRRVDLGADLGIDGIEVEESPAFRTLLANLVRYLEQSGQYAAAHEVASETFQRWRRTLGADHPETLTVAHRLANVLFRAGEHRRAYVVYQETYRRRRAVLGVDDPATLNSADAFASVQAVLGEVDAARALHADILARRRRLFGDDHPDTLAVAAHLANTLHAAGDYPAAHALAEETWDRRRVLLGDDHPGTLASAHSLALERSALRGPGAGRDLLRETLDRRRRVLGADHPSTLATAYGLAQELFAVGEETAARDLLDDTLARRRRVLGDAHPSTLATVRGFGADPTSPVGGQPGRPGILSDAYQSTRAFAVADSHRPQWWERQDEQDEQDEADRADRADRADGADRYEVPGAAAGLDEDEADVADRYESRPWRRSR